MYRILTCSSKFELLASVACDSQCHCSASSTSGAPQQLLLSPPLPPTLPQAPHIVSCTAAAPSFFLIPPHPVCNRPQPSMQAVENDGYDYLFKALHNRVHSDVAQRLPLMFCHCTIALKIMLVMLEITGCSGGRQRCRQVKSHFAVYQ